jgi:hypothetical protein
MNERQAEMTSLKWFARYSMLAHELKSPAGIKDELAITDINRHKRTRKV